MLPGGLAPTNGTDVVSLDGPAAHFCATGPSGVGARPTGAAQTPPQVGAENASEATRRPHWQSSHHGIWTSCRESVAATAATAAASGATLPRHTSEVVRLHAAGLAFDHREVVASAIADDEWRAATCPTVAEDEPAAAAAADAQVLAWAAEAGLDPHAAMQVPEVVEWDLAELANLSELHDAELAVRWPPGMYPQLARYLMLRRGFT